MKTFLFLGLMAVSAAYGADAGATASPDYAEAARQTEQKLASSPPSAEAYYDLGLASEKTGNPVQAALNYQRSLLLDPGLRSARNAFAKLAVAQSIPLPPHSWVDDVNAVVHPDTLVKAGTILVWAGIFGILAATQITRRRTLVRTLSILVLIVGGTSVTMGCLSDPRLDTAIPAVVTAKDGAEILNAPANNSEAVLSVPAGTPVGVLSPRGSWTYIEVGGGARGWVPTDRLTPTIPSETL